MRLILVMLAAAIGGCAAAPADSARPPQPEAVYAAIAGKDALRVRVSSNGCTEKQHFRTERRGGEIALRRVTPDHCKSFASGSVWLEFSYAELGVGREPFRLGNPLTPWMGPGE
jgi:hypothetical protein